MNSNKDKNYQDFNSVSNINQLNEVNTFLYKNSYFWVKVKINHYLLKV